MLIGLVETPAGGWEPPILRTIATKDEGTNEAIQAIQQHRDWLSSSSRGKARSVTLMRQRLLQLLLDDIRETVEEGCRDLLDQAAEKVASHATSVLEALELLRAAYIELAGTSAPSKHT